MKESIELMLKFSFEQLSLKRVQAGVHETNIASQKVLERTGFIKEAQLRKQIYSAKNIQEFEDHLFYGILNSEWEKAQ